MPTPSAQKSRTGLMIGVTVVVVLALIAAASLLFRPGPQGNDPSRIPNIPTRPSRKWSNTEFKSAVYLPPYRTVKDADELLFFMADSPTAYSEKKLVALNATTGQVAWDQQIGLVSQCSVGGAEIACALSDGTLTVYGAKVGDLKTTIVVDIDHTQHSVDAVRTTDDAIFVLIRTTQNVAGSKTSVAKFDLSGKQQWITALSQAKSSYWSSSGPGFITTFSANPDYLRITLPGSDQPTALLKTTDGSIVAESVGMITPFANGQVSVFDKATNKSTVKDRSGKTVFVANGAVVATSKGGVLYRDDTAKELASYTWAGVQTGSHPYPHKAQECWPTVPDNQTEEGFVVACDGLLVGLNPDASNAWEMTPPMPQRTSPYSSNGGSITTCLRDNERDLCFWTSSSLKKSGAFAFRRNSGASQWELELPYYYRETIAASNFGIITVSGEAYSSDPSRIALYR